MVPQLGMSAEYNSSVLSSRVRRACMRDTWCWGCLKKKKHMELIILEGVVVKWGIPLWADNVSPRYHPLSNRRLWCEPLFLWVSLHKHKDSLSSLDPFYCLRKAGQTRLGKNPLHSKLKSSPSQSGMQTAHSVCKPQQGILLTPEQN